MNQIFAGAAAPKWAGLLLAASLAACSADAPAPVADKATPAAAAPSAGDTYTLEDFAKVRKFDSHVHVNEDVEAFLQQAQQDNFEVLSINVDYPDFPSIALQHTVALAQAKRDPQHFHWAATFTMQGFEQPGWEQKVDASLTQAKAEGAKAVKIWKNVGMIERDSAGKLIMLDHPKLSPVADRIQALGLPLIGHQGEPHNCWLPLEQMSTDNDREYFKNHPEYHMYLHPDQPSYEDQIAARDRFVAAHPQLHFVGAHMGSMEYDVDRIGAFLDRYPNANIDLAARMSQVQYQSVRDREKVRNFFIKYQDRILYGTDLTLPPGANAAEFKQSAHEVWTSDWRYLATGESQRVDMIKADVPGLALPREVINKVYYGNAMREFALQPAAPAAGKAN